MADQVAVRHLDGRIHGFLVLRDLDDNILASGGLTQLANGNRVTTELIFHFKDGPSHEETAVFSQRRTFQLLTYHWVQKGRAFKRPTDVSLNASLIDGFARPLPANRRITAPGCQRTRTE
jgi:hypothetical protein